MDDGLPYGRRWAARCASITALARVGVIAVAISGLAVCEAGAKSNGVPQPVIGSAPVPLPPPRLGVPIPPTPDAPSPARADVPTPKSAASADPTLCLDRLAKLGVKVEPRPPIVDGACGAPHPFRVSNLPDGVEASPAAEVGCPMAEALARWVDEVVEPEAKTHLGLAPKTIQIGTSYECRGQNRASAAKLSEHAFANAVDIMGFTFDKGPALPVKERSADTPEGRFQAAVKSRACAYFSTVLGPGSDPTHTDHLHLDLRARKGGYRICQ